MLFILLNYDKPFSSENLFQEELKLEAAGGTTPH